MTDTATGQADERTREQMSEQAGRRANKRTDERATNCTSWRSIQSFHHNVQQKQQKQPQQQQKVSLRKVKKYMHACKIGDEGILKNKVMEA